MGRFLNPLPKDMESEWSVPRLWIAAPACLVATHSDLPHSTLATALCMKALDRRGVAMEMSSPNEAAVEPVSPATVQRNLHHAQ